MKIFLSIIFSLAILLRLYTLPQNLFYAFEQGRDLQVIRSIALEHKLTLIGPRTSIEGIFHGVLYYYSAVLPFIFSQGNPLGIMAFFIFWQSLGVIFIYKFVGASASKTTAWWASALYATSYGLIFYSRWFSHPPQILPFSLLLFWSLWKITKEKNFYLLAAFSWSAIFHLDLVVAIFFLPAIFLYFLWQKPKKPSLVIAIGVLITMAIFFAPYFLFDLRHNFLMTNSLVKFFAVGSEPLDLVKATSHLWFRYTSEVQDVLAPNFPPLSLAIFFSSLIWLILRRNKTAFEKLILLWVLSIPTWGIFISPLFGLKHYLIGLGAGIVILTVYWLTHFWQSKFKILAIGVLLFLLFNNLLLIKEWLPKNRHIFYLFPQPGMVLGSQLKVLDYIYPDAGGKNFGWEAFTIPYWSPAGWQYLFLWYGTKKYGYVPKELKKGDIFYVIIEPVGDKLFLDNWLREKMNERGKLLEEKSFGTIRVQKRTTIQ